MQAVPAIRSRILAQWLPNIFRGDRKNRRGSSNELGIQLIHLKQLGERRKAQNILESKMKKPQVGWLSVSTNIALGLSSKIL
jgi:hypothetical protein